VRMKARSVSREAWAKVSGLGMRLGRGAPMLGHLGASGGSQELPTAIPVSRQARSVLVLGVISYLAFYLTWVLTKHQGFSTYGFDLGIHDQAMWLLSRGKSPFITISGNPYFGDHLYFLMAPLAPLYWLLDDVRVLIVLQPVVLALAAVPLFLIAREKLRSEWLASGMVWAYFLNPYVGWITLEEFHPDVFEVPLVFAIFWFALRKRWAGFLVTALLLLLAKEDTPLLLLGVGVWVALRYHRRLGILTTLLAAGWFLLNFKVLLPVLGGTGSLGAYISTHGERIPFGGLGGLLGTLFTKPWRVIGALFGPRRPLYYLQVFAPLGFAPFLSPSTLAAVMAPLLANGLSTFWYQQTIERHYGTLVIPGLLVAALYGIAHLPVRIRKSVVGLVIISAIIGLYLWGPAPGSRHPGHWVTSAPSYAQTAEEAIDMIPAQASVSADYHLVTHLSHRSEIYEFPCPWLDHNWEDGRSTDRTLSDRAEEVEYVLVLRESKPQVKETLDRLMKSGNYQTVLDREGVVLLAREGPAK